MQEQAGGGTGTTSASGSRKDRDGNVIPNTYLMAMDYSGINYDYQDNVYLITNIKPERPGGADRPDRRRRRMASR